MLLIPYAMPALMPCFHFLAHYFLSPGHYAIITPPLSLLPLIRHSWLLRRIYFATFRRVSAFASHAAITLSDAIILILASPLPERWLSRRYFITLIAPFRHAAAAAALLRCRYAAALFRHFHYAAASTDADAAAIFASFISLH